MYDEVLIFAIIELAFSKEDIGMSSNGRTTAFGAVYSGSNPGVPAKFLASKNCIKLCNPL